MVTLLKMAMLTDTLDVVFSAFVEKQPAILFLSMLVVVATSFGLLNVIVGITVVVVSRNAEQITTEREQKVSVHRLEQLDNIQDFVVEMDAETGGAGIDDELQAALVETNWDDAVSKAKSYSTLIFVSGAVAAGSAGLATGVSVTLTGTSSPADSVKVLVTSS